jgi:hypothetical protein
MAVSSEGTAGTTSPQYCPECGHPCTGELYCTECGHAVAGAPASTDITEELPRAGWPRRAPSTQAPIRPPATGRSRSRIILIAAAGALALAAIAVIAIVLLNSSSPSAPSQTTSYSVKLSSALAPVVSANQSLSGALQAIDGSKKTIGAAQSATSQAQSAVAAARGAVGVLTVPNSETSLSQQAQQALTEENGYLQALASTLSDPAGQSSSQLRPLITATQSAMVPLAQVAPGATSSLSGIDNVLSWVAGATAASQAATQKAQQQSSSAAKPSQQQTTASAPSGSPSGLTSCDQNISVNSATSCAFADNVFYAYAQDVQENGGPSSYVVYAYSPATGQDYDDTCSYNPSNQLVLCSHGSDLIQFPYWAAEVYQPG